MATEEEIRHLAHAIWEREGRPEGKADEHWYRAKQFLEDQELLSISDWISFLTAEKNPNIAIIVTFTAVWLAIFFSIVNSVTNNTLVSAITAALMVVALLVIYLQAIGRYGHRAKEAGKLLKAIMLGKERDPSKIEERWRLVEGSQKNK
jgi:hypothetical protein